MCVPARRDSRIFWRHYSLLLLRGSVLQVRSLCGGEQIMTALLFFLVNCPWKAINKWWRDEPKAEPNSADGGNEGGFIGQTGMSRWRLDDPRGGDCGEVGCEAVDGRACRWKRAVDRPHADMHTDNMSQTLKVFFHFLRQKLRRPH